MRIPRVVLFLLMASVALSSAQDKQAPGSLGGVVLAFGENRPMADVPMELTLAGDRLALTRRRNESTSVGKIKTDRAGRFAFDKLEPGYYFLTPGPGFAYPGRRRDFGRQALYVYPGEQVRLRLPVVSVAMLAGQVFDVAGKPLASVQLELYEMLFNDRGEKYLGESRVAAISDSEGRYLISDVEPGELYLAARPSAKTPLFPTTFYPGVVDAENSTPIRVPNGGTLSGMDLRLVGGSLYTITITVPKPSGLSDAFTPLFMISTESRGRFKTDLISPGPVVSVFTPIGRDRYRSIPLPPDSYVVEVRWRGPGTENDSGVTLLGSTSRYPKARFPVELIDKNVDAGTLTNWSQSTSISGRVFFGTPAPQLGLPTESGLADIENFPLYIRSMEYAAGYVSEDIPIAVRTDGTFKLREVPPGSYTIHDELPAPWYVSSGLFAGRETIDRVFIVEPDSTGPLDITLAQGAGTITGTVQTVSGDAVTLGTVVLVPELSRRGNPSLFTVTKTDHKGAFTLRGVPPGNYTVLAWDWVRWNSYYNAEILAESEGRGVKVTVEARSRQNINVRAIEGSR